MEDPSIPSDEREARWWAVAIHLSLLLTAVAPVAGYVAPILIWLIKRDEFPEIDRHGRNAVNWIITQVALGALSVILWFTIILIPVAWLLGIALYLLGIAFPIVAALRAKEGIAWRYPFTLPLM